MLNVIITELDFGFSFLKKKNGHPPSESTNHVQASPASSQDTAAETPSSSTATTAVATSSDQVTEEIANGYRLDYSSHCPSLVLWCRHVSTKISTDRE